MVHSMAHYLINMYSILAVRYVLMFGSRPGSSAEPCKVKSYTQKFKLTYSFTD